METVDEAAFIPSTHTSFRTAWEREQLIAMRRQKQDGRTCYLSSNPIAESAWVVPGQWSQGGWHAPVLLPAQGTEFKTLTGRLPSFLIFARTGKPGVNKNGGGENSCCT